MKRTIGKSYLWISLFMSSIFPMALGLALANYFTDWRWSHYPFHSMVESAGAFAALTIAILMIIMVNNNHLSKRYIWVASALIGMGLLDGFHSALHVGVPFVWLHSIATLVGGILFAAIWLPESWLTNKRQYNLIITTGALSLTIGIISITHPESLPTMVIDNNFSILAKTINVIGGIGFLTGSYFFIHNYYKKLNDREHELEGQSKDIVFANHCLLFGIAGLLFETSMLWDAGWWWWHILRFLAYFVVLTFFFVLFRDEQNKLKINEIKLGELNNNLEVRVQQRTHELEKANRAKSEFLSHMSHELRTPMNAILGFSQLLDMKKETLDTAQKSHLGEILVAGKHLLDLIEDVLDLSRIESGKLEISVVSVDLNETLQKCINLMMPAVNARNIILTNNTRTDQPFVNADPVRLKQVLLNLMSNAVKYNRDNGSIVLTSDIVSPQRIRIQVRDTGEGLGENDITRIFKPFERVKGINNVDGAGIGLTISKQLTELMGGTIGVESHQSEGCTFWIELDLANQV